MLQEIPIADAAAAGLRRAGARDAVLVRDDSDRTILIAAGPFADGLELRLAAQRNAGPAADAYLVASPGIERDGDGSAGSAWLAQAAASNRLYVYAAPATGRETALAAIWAEALDLPAVGAQDDFVDLGGDSLIAVEVIERAETECGLSFSVTDLYQHGTVRALAGMANTGES